MMPGYDGGRGFRARRASSSPNTYMCDRIRGKLSRLAGILRGYGGIVRQSLVSGGSETVTTEPRGGRCSWCDELANKPTYEDEDV